MTRPIGYRPPACVESGKVVKEFLHSPNGAAVQARCPTCAQVLWCTLHEGWHVFPEHIDREKERLDDIALGGAAE